MVTSDFSLFRGSTTMFGVRTLVLAATVYAAAMDLTACTSSQASQDPRTVPQLAEVAMVQPAEAGERACEECEFERPTS